MLYNLTVCVCDATGSMSSIWLTDVVKKYSGVEDIEAWLDRLKLILELQKAGGASVDPAAVILLFLEGQVYDVYAELGPDVHGNVDRLEGALRATFGLSPFMAFTKFKACSLRDTGCFPRRAALAGPGNLP